MNNYEKIFFRQSLQMSGFMLFLMFSFVASVLFIATPLALNMIIQQEGVISAVNILLILGIIATGHAVQVLSVFSKNRLTQNYHVKSASRLWNEIFKVKYDVYLEKGPSMLLTRVHECSQAYANFYFNTVPSMIVNMIMVATSVIIAFTVNPLVAGIMLLTLPFNYFSYRALNGRLGVLSLKLSQICSEAWRNQDAVVSQVDFIKQNATNELLLPLIENNVHKAQDITRQVNNYANGVSMILNSINQIVRMGLIVFLGALILADIEMLGGALFIMLILPYFTNSVSGLTNLNLDFASLKAAQAFFSDISNNLESSGKSEIADIQDIRLDIKELSLGGQIFLKDINMNLKKGDIVGIMGESGKGKSTLAKLLLKFRESAGIYVNGIDLNDISTKNYLNLVSYYSQNTPIISDTLYNNLNLGVQHADKSVYKNLDFLQKFSDLDEQILENGANLSGGDKQRIAMARFFTEKSQLVILDEPTSSLDSETESQLLGEIMQKNKDKIIILISHNLENMKYCNSVYEFRDNRLVSV
ncbi:MAG: ABC transporter ATP-binding protein/permease [Turicibacter sp.]|nr:ABC transporter ATP-binding protein/permease [Turicibacter sp.]